MGKGRGVGWNPLNRAAGMSPHHEGGGRWRRVHVSLENLNGFRLHRAGRDVALGEDRGDRTALEHDDRADTALGHRCGCVTERALRRDSQQVPRHVVGDQRHPAILDVPPMEENARDRTLSVRRGDLRGPWAVRDVIICHCVECRRWTGSVGAFAATRVERPRRRRDRDTSLDRQSREPPTGAARLLRRVRLEPLLAGGRRGAGQHRGRNARPTRPGFASQRTSTRTRRATGTRFPRTAFRATRTSARSTSAGPELAKLTQGRPRRLLYSRA